MHRLHKTPYDKQRRSSVHQVVLEALPLLYYPNCHSLHNNHLEYKPQLSHHTWTFIIKQSEHTVNMGK